MRPELDVILGPNVVGVALREKIGVTAGEDRAERRMYTMTAMFGWRASSAALVCLESMFIVAVTCKGTMSAWIGERLHPDCHPGISTTQHNGYVPPCRQ